MVFYRKYRPQTIDDLDSKAVRETLHAVLQKNTPHAFLFTGPKGLGKTSTARIIAKAVNCEKKYSTINNPPSTKKEKELKVDSGKLTINDSEPCNTCDQCISITNGTNVDILEIDAASNRGIDEIRELKEKIRLAPVSARKKVYIIDEVHMLTTEAFNALLKTLEEPPEHAMFVLCTTEPQKIPATILSRCFHMQFKPATEEELVRSFKRIVAGEKLQIDDEALKAIAKMADGGFRDGVKVLEELVLLANGQPITKELVEKKYQVASIKYQVASMLEALQKRDTRQGLEIVQELSKQGANIKHFLQELMESLHEILLSQTGVGGHVVDSKQQVSIDEIRIFFGLFSKAYGEMKNAVLPQLPLELAIIQWCESKLKVQNEELKVSNGVSKSIIAEDTEVSVSSLRKQVGTIKKLKALYGTVKSNPTEEVEVSVETASVELLQTTGDGTVTKEWMELFWRNLISEMKKYNHTVAGVLRGCTIKSYAEQKLVIQTAYKFHKERLDDMKNRDTLLKISKLLTGKDIEITVELRK